MHFGISVLNKNNKFWDESDEEMQSWRIEEWKKAGEIQTV